MGVEKICAQQHSNRHICHSELVSESIKQMLKQVQHDSLDFRVWGKNNPFNLLKQCAAFTLAEKAKFPRPLRERARERGLKAAFTLAEVLITLAIIGVVAAVAMPMLITNINERTNSERQANIVYKITQAMEHMRALGKLTAYDSTEAFVDELQKHLKITKRCDKDHLTECWPTEEVRTTSGETFNVADAKTGENLSLTTETNNVGLILADGASIILNFDNNFEGLDVGSKVQASSIGLPSGNGKAKVYQYTTTSAAPIAFVMDVNGKKGPNSETIDNKYYDIRNFGGAQFASSQSACAGDEYNDTCIYYVGTAYTSINCSSSNSSDPLYSYCSPTPSTYSNDYWAGAKYKCDSMNMDLPTVAQLQSIYANKSNFPSIASNTSWFRSSEEYSSNPQLAAGRVYFNDGNDGFTQKNFQGQVLCLGR